VRAREDAVHSLRAVFAAKIVGGPRDGSSTTGVLVVQKPDRFRLRLMLPIGLTVLDYLNDGDSVSVSLPLRGDDAEQAPLPFSEADLKQAFLRGAWAFSGQCQAAPGTSAAEAIATCRDANGVILRELDLEVDGAHLRQETSYEGGQPRFYIRYSEFGPDAMPRRIVLGQPGRDVRLEIEIERYEINPVLSQRLFAP
jgi:outer membrane lipoprotein-sorting protein